MALFIWSGRYSVGVREIDNQHQKLVVIINELHDAMQAGKGRDVLGKIYTELVTYTKTHFSYEEKLMKEKNYPEYSKHLQEHINLTTQVTDMYNDYQSGKSQITMELLTFLTNWLSNHILGTDKKYSTFFNAAGVS